MNATLSTRQIRVVAMLVLAVVAVGGFLVVTHKSTTTTTAPTKPAHTTQVTTSPTPTKTHTHTVTPTKLNTHGLPVPVVRALQKHSVVVVALLAPRGTDQLATGLEAGAGAAQSKAGFVAIDAFRQKTGTAMLRKLGVVDTPEVLVIRRSGAITSQFKGFVDRDVVAQAVADAR
jgi:hypothetical protein